MSDYPWIKVWADMLQHPKIRRLTSDEFRLWMQCLALAALRRGEHGRFYLSPGQPFAYEDLADLAKVPLECVAPGIAKMVSLGLIAEDEDGILVIPSWDERQFGKPSNHPDAARERKRISRARDGHAGVTPPYRMGHADVTRESRDGHAVDKEEDKEGDTPPLTPPQGGESGKRPPAPGAVAALAPGGAPSAGDEGRPASGEAAGPSRAAAAPSIQHDAGAEAQGHSGEGPADSGVSKGEPQVFLTEFQQVWDVYPRKLDKGLAFRAYVARRRQGMAFQDLLRAATHYAGYCRARNTDQQYIKRAATFFGPSEPWREWIEGIPAGEVANGNGHRERVPSQALYRPSQVDWEHEQPL